MSEFYVSHDREFLDESGKSILWRGLKKGVPEVYVLAETAVKITPEIKQLILDLNPGMTKGELTSLLKKDRGFTNNGPHSLDKVRICGGAILHGTLDGDLLTVETIDADKPLPSAAEVKARGLYYEAITVQPGGSNGVFPQNKKAGHVYMPLIARGVVKVKINELVPGKPDKPWIRRI